MGRPDNCLDKMILAATNYAVSHGCKQSDKLSKRINLAIEKGLFTQPFDFPEMDVFEEDGYLPSREDVDQLKEYLATLSA